MIHNRFDLVFVHGFEVEIKGFLFQTRYHWSISLLQHSEAGFAPALFAEVFVNREHYPVEVGEPQRDLSLMALQELLLWHGQHECPQPIPLLGTDMLNHEENLVDGWVSFASIGSVDKALQKMRALLERCATEPHGA